MKLRKTSSSKTVTITDRYVMENGLKVHEVITDGKTGINLPRKDGKWVLCFHPGEFEELVAKENFQLSDLMKAVERRRPESLDDLDSFEYILMDPDSNLLFTPEGKIKSYPYNSVWEHHLADTRSQKGKACFVKLVDALKGHEWISNVKVEDVPYYNASFSGQECISYFTVRIPDGVLQELWDRVQKTEVKYPSATLREVITMKYYTLDKYNLYGDKVTDLLKELSDYRSDEDCY